MILETAFRLNMTALRAWVLLADLAGYVKWHPTYRFIGPMHTSGAIILSWRMFGDRRVQMHADIDRLEKPSIVSWTYGVRPLMTMHEVYELQADGSHVDVRHRVECRGFFGRLTGLLLRRGVRNTMRMQDAAFLAHAKRHMRAGPLGNRHRRRANLSQKNRKAAND